jgi:hypothetical protein
VVRSKELNCLAVRNMNVTKYICQDFAEFGGGAQLSTYSLPTSIVTLF